MSVKKHNKARAKIRVPYGFSVHGKKEIDAVVKVLNGNTALGKHTEKFEKKIAKLFGKKYGIMVNSGSSANLLAFEILNLPRGSEVITPILTFATTVAPIVQKGLVPVFVDVDEDTYQVNIDQVEKAITKKTRALMIPSLLGNMPNMRKLAKLAKKHGLWFIEDSCDTLGGKYDKQPTGKYSHITTTSFYGSHIINGAGGGGMICVNDAKWKNRLTVLRGWGRHSSLFGEKRNSELIKNRFNSKLAGIPYDNKFVFSELGYNFLPLELSAAFALTQLKRLPKFANAREKNFKVLLKHFKKYEDYFVLPNQTPKTETLWLAFPLIIKDGAPFTRLELVKFLEKNGIQTRPIFTGNVLKQPGFEHIKRRCPQKLYPNAENIMRSGLMVACHHGLTQKQIAYLKTKFSEFLTNNTT